MKKTSTLLLFAIVLTISACTPQATAIPMPLPATEPAMPVETHPPIAVSPTETAQSATLKLYTNSAFKFGFKYPSNWFGPDEYVSGNTLRLAIGSDVVYPYGEVPETPSEVKNSYLVVIQYTKNNQGDNGKDISYQALANMKDGEALSGARNLTIRVRELHLGRFDGFEYISTVSETAQTEYFYTRVILLLDKQTNDLLSILGQPNNVEVGNGASWRDAYQAIDEANLPLFHKIVESIAAE